MNEAHHVANVITHASLQFVRIVKLAPSSILFLGGTHSFLVGFFPGSLSALFLN